VGYEARKILSHSLSKFLRLNLVRKTKNKMAMLLKKLF